MGYSILQLLEGVATGMALLHGFLNRFKRTSTAKKKVSVREIKSYINFCMLNVKLSWLEN